MAAPKELLQPRPRDAQSRSLPAVPDIDSMMKRAFEGTAAAAGARREAVQTRRDPATAFDLIDRAAEAFDVLISRCEELEAKIDADAERARAEAAAQEEVIARWKSFGTGMKAQAEETDKQLRAMKARAEAAEARAAAAESRATDLQASLDKAIRQAAAAEDLSTEFHDKVIATFGIGSRAHFALEVVSKTPAVEQGASAA